MDYKKIFACLLALCLLAGCACALAEESAPLAYVTFDQERFVIGEEVTAHVEVRGKGAEECKLELYAWCVYAEDGSTLETVSVEIENAGDHSGVFTYTPTAGNSLSLVVWGVTGDGDLVGYLSPVLHEDGITEYELNDSYSYSQGKQVLRFTFDKDLYTPGEEGTVRLEWLGPDAENWSFDRCEVMMGQPSGEYMAFSVCQEIDLSETQGSIAEVTFTAPPGTDLALSVSGHHTNGETIEEHSKGMRLEEQAPCIVWEKPSVVVGESIHAQYELPKMEGYELGEYWWVYVDAEGMGIGFAGGKLESDSGTLTGVVDVDDIIGLFNDSMGWGDSIPNPAKFKLRLSLEMISPDGNVVDFTDEVPIDGLSATIVYDSATAVVNQSVGVQYELPEVAGLQPGAYQWMVEFAEGEKYLIIDEGLLETHSGQLSYTMTEDMSIQLLEEAVNRGYEMDPTQFKLFFVPYMANADGNSIHYLIEGVSLDLTKMAAE